MKDSEAKKIALTLFKGAEQNIKRGNLAAARAYRGKMIRLMRKHGIVELPRVSKERMQNLLAMK